MAKKVSICTRRSTGTLKHYLLVDEQGAKKQ
jgi:hypothetical protein